MVVKSKITERSIQILSGASDIDILKIGYDQSGEHFFVTADDCVNYFDEDEFYEIMEIMKQTMKEHGKKKRQRKEKASGDMETR